MSLFTFAVLALLAVGSAAGMLLRRNPIHGALFLAINLSTVAALSDHARGVPGRGADHIYAGAIAVLFVFAIMVLIQGKEERARSAAPAALAGGAVVAVF